MQNVLTDIVENLNPSSVHYLNGRTFYERITLEVCKKLGHKSIAYETNIDGDRYQSFEGSIANLQFQTTAMNDFWDEYVESHGMQAAVTMAERFFLDRIQNPRFNQFLLEMERESFFSKNAEETIYTFFTSSSEEMISIYSLYGVEPPNQNELILNLIHLFESEENQNRKLVIRVHPNLKSKKDMDKKFYNSLSDSKKVKIFAHDSGVNSYHLVSQSDFVLTSVSTIGLESAYLQVPTFCFGKTFWSGLEISTHLTSVVDLLKSAPVETHVAYRNALKAGLFYLEYGERYEFTNMNKLTDSSGKYVFDPLRWFLLKVKLENIQIVKNSGRKGHDSY